MSSSEGISDSQTSHVSWRERVEIACLLHVYTFMLYYVMYFLYVDMYCIVTVYTRVISMYCVCPHSSLSPFQVSSLSLGLSQETMNQVMGAVGLNTAMGDR